MMVAGERWYAMQKKRFSEAAWIVFIGSELLNRTFWRMNNIIEDAATSST